MAIDVMFTTLQVVGLKKVRRAAVAPPPQSDDANAPGPRWAGHGRAVDAALSVARSAAPSPVPTSTSRWDTPAASGWNVAAAPPSGGSVQPPAPYVQFALHPAMQSWPQAMQPGGYASGPRQG